MGNFKFSRNSQNKLNTCHKDLQKVFNLAIQRTNVDFGISDGHRSIERQQQLYAQGRTQPGSIVTYVDGVNKKSKHNYSPSLAVDIFAYFNGRASWDVKHLCYLGGIIMCCTSELRIPLVWGGNWDNDGIIISDQRFQDLPHFQLV